MTGAAGMGPYFRCGGYGHFSKDCPTRTQGRDRSSTPQYGKMNNNQYFPLQMLGTNPPTLTQQITTHGVITPEAWVKIQEKVNTLAENNELIDKCQRTLGRSHNKLKKFTKSMHKTTGSSAASGDNPKQQKKKLDDRWDKKKVKFTTPPSGDQVKSGKHVNVVHKEDPYSSDGETSVSSDGSEQLRYFDLLSSSSEEYDTDDNLNDDK